MGGVFGVVSNNDCVMDIFFGTDYHSHLGTKRGGMCILEKDGFNRAIHNISNSAFRSKFESEIETMKGNCGIGAISDSDPQPLTVRSRQGEYAITTVGRINNKEELVEQLIASRHGQFMSMSGGNINNTELVAALVSQGSDIVEGIKNAQDKIEGSCTMLILTEDGMYAARDKDGRTPLILGRKGTDSYCAASESFAFINIGYTYTRELGPGEIAFITSAAEKTVAPPRDRMRVCTFLWTYFGYTTSIYEGKNVELMRNRNGASMADRDGDMDVDYVAGVPDSGIAHALGYANQSRTPYARPLIKYTPTWPRSFMPQNQKARNLIAKMKLVPVFQIIKDKKFVLVDDSIVRGTQLSETVAYLLENGAKEIHVRSACPPIMFGCKYLNFSRSVSDMELITRRCIRELEGMDDAGDAAANPAGFDNNVQSDIPAEVLAEYADAKTERHKNMVALIKEKLNFDSLKFQELDSLLDATEVERCNLCTYCWDGKE
ncbi:MAG: amidophosphoribosyltransferase [Eubacteriaceae bacterium]|nr:amidophosphoribosyltransferase [Eubacteriaceae bacterium]